MPVLNGLEMIKQIRALDKIKTIPIIASSASVFETDKHQSLETGADDFLPKPVQIYELLKKVQQQLQIEWIYQLETKSQSVAKTTDKELVFPPEQEL